MDEINNNEGFNSLLAVPSIFVMICILLLFSKRRWRSLLLENQLMAGFILTLFVMNILEVLTYGNIYTNYETSLKIYYCTATVLASFFLCLSERLNENSRANEYILYSSIALISITISSTTFFTDLIIAGYSKNSFTVSRIPGEYYWIFQLFALAYIFLGVSFILRSIKTSINSLDKKRRIVIFISFIPLVLTSVLALIFIQFDLYINQLVFLPFSTLIFILTYLFTETRHDLFRFLINIPFSPERAAYKTLNNRVIEYISKTQTNEKFPLKEFMHDIETSIIENVLEIKEGDHNLTAEMLSVSLSTVYRNKKKKTEKSFK